MTDHIEFDRQAMILRLLDQRKLPLERSFVVCANARDTAVAIADMVVRGAPAIGVTAAWGCVLAAHSHQRNENWREAIGADLALIDSARPTAVNLAWAVKRMAKLMPLAESPQQLLTRWLDEAASVQAEDIAICEQLGAAGAAITPDGATVLTHCNAGALATAGHGTALGVIRSAIAQGKRVRVIADETRPFLQGSRLTAYELREDGIDVTLACDNACAHLMASGQVDLVIVGADRIAANGDTANKIGTMGVAILANYFHIPFYVAAPVSTIDTRTSSGRDIPIECRPEEEVLRLGGQPIAPSGVSAHNFAFDVTPCSLITGIITERGILRAPYGEAIASLFRGVESSL